MKHGALPPLHSRPNDGWARRNNACSFTTISLMSPDIRSSPVYTDCGRFRACKRRNSCLESIFLLSAQLASTFFFLLSHV